MAEYLPFLFIAVLIYLWFSQKVGGKRISLYAGYSAVLGVVFNLLITVFYFHPRPFMDKIGTTLINHVPETSFPSDHTTFMLSVAMTLLIIKETRKTGIILCFFGIIGGLSRVFCGIHYPLDILGSLAVALVSSSLVLTFSTKLEIVNKFIINAYSQIVKKRP